MSSDGPRDDFASAAMMRLVAAGLARQGIDTALRRPVGAHVPRMEKSAALGAVSERYGPIAVLKIPDAAEDMQAEPLMIALTRARSLGDLLERWQRLERFSHRRHAVVSETPGGDVLHLAHRSRDAGPPPSEAESLLVLGLLAKLAELIGLAEVTMVSGDGHPLRKGRAWHAPPPGAQVQRVTLSGRPRATDPPRQDPGPDDEIVGQLRQRVLEDPLHRWTLADFATQAGLSRRTLQRRLSEQGQSVSHIVAEARLSVAANYLCDADGPGLAEIGFLSGYADQAHFSRCFRRSVGTKPSAFRADFQA